MNSDCNLLFCYAWDDHQPRIKALEKLLQVYRGIKVLTGIDDGFRTITSIERFQSANFVIFFLSSALKNCERCRCIFSKTSVLQKKIILFTLEDDFEVSGWIQNFLVEPKMLDRSILFTKDSSNYEEIINSLLKAISFSSQTPYFLGKTEIIDSKEEILASAEKNVADLDSCTIPVSEDKASDEIKANEPVFCGRQIKVFYQHNRNSRNIDDIYSILCHLADRQLILVQKHEPNVDFSILFIEKDEKVGLLEGKHLIVDFRNKEEQFKHCESCFHLWAAPLAFHQLVEALEKIISEILLVFQFLLNFFSYFFSYFQNVESEHTQTISSN